MKRIVLIFLVLVLIGLARAGLAQAPPLPDIIILGLINEISVTTAFNPATGLMEGSGNRPFRVKIWTPGAIGGTVEITSVTCPVTKQVASGSTVGYLSAFLSRNDLLLPSPSITDIILTVWIKAPLTVPAGTYTGGAVQITATANF